MTQAMAVEVSYGIGLIHEDCGNLASVLNLRGKAGEALPLLQRAQALLARQPSQDPNVISQEEAERRMARWLEK